MAAKPWVVRQIFINFQKVSSLQSYRVTVHIGGGSQLCISDLASLIQSRQKLTQIELQKMLWLYPHEGSVRKEGDPMCCTHTFANAHISPAHAGGRAMHVQRTLITSTSFILDWEGMWDGYPFTNILHVRAMVRLTPTQFSHRKCWSNIIYRGLKYWAKVFNDVRLHFVQVPHSHSPS